MQRRGEATDVLGVEQRFNSLSVKDLLEARDLYHVHLVHKPNVVGTAVGRYLIRVDDPWPTRREHQEKKPVPAAKKPERRFDNSEVRDYSWPCVIVLVDTWEDDPDNIVPATLYMPDGRRVPVCKVRVIREQAALSSIPHWVWPEGLFGGGMPLVVDSQHTERIASAGCLVSDGHTIYVLTNRHVCGSPGQPVYTLESGRRVLIGHASNKQLTRRSFEKVYGGFAGRQTWLNLDVGLVEVEDAGAWTSQVYGLGAVGPLADLSEINISLRLVDEPVRAHGAASGTLEGQIKALFYRYRSVGGFEYVADFLIAPLKHAKIHTQPGDSGTIWHLVQTKDGHEVLRPLAIEWGGQTLADQTTGDSENFALATTLSNVCQLLDVELMVEHNIGVAPYWGQMGHYSIGSFACDFVTSDKLTSLMKANRDRISFDAENLDPKEISTAIKDAKNDEQGFIPLADVPDLVWKSYIKKVTGGRDTIWGARGRSNGPEHPTHYADIDEVRPSDGKTLRQLCIDDPKNVDVAVWQKFYTDVGHTEFGKRGLLPFRVWQFFDVMVQAVKDKKLDEFVCAAGLVSHYVGDACQPLHGSMLADGYADQPTTIEHTRRDSGETYTEDSHVGAGVHSAYETNMVDRFAAELVDGLNKALKKPPKGPKPVDNGHEVAVAVVQLMDRTAKRLPPEKIIKTFLDAGGKKVVATYQALWDEFGDKTIETMVDGSQVLAMIWDSAWSAGGGDAIAASALKAIGKDKLKELYEQTDFVPSVDLDHVAGYLS